MAKKKSTKKEQELPKSSGKFPIIGIGASAGGLSAFDSFFSSIPQNSNIGMAFVVVQHLDPTHKSILAEIIQKYTTMDVYEIKDGMVVQQNCVYIIPPNHNLGILNGTLELIEAKLPRGQRLPIDYFFQSLAQDQHEYAVGIILSGTGHDGTNGIESIKAEGGLVVAQSIESSEFDGMPSSVINTGLADYTLSPSSMFNKLTSYRSNIHKHYKISESIHKNENILNKIFILLRSETSHDFSMYKPNTISRRIERRMMVHQIDTVDEYYKYMQQEKGEVEELFNDLLIGVTSFFRDKDAFEDLRKDALPKLFKDKQSGDSIRVWIAGCSTGEEAYSIAIILMEYMEKIKQNYLVQIFATDINPSAIVTARAGLFPATITADISQDRIKRFFIKNSDTNLYNIRKNIRDMLVFSVHNVIKDPPFSKIDLISCRNLLIYMNIELQKKLISLFHYSLDSNGILFLGSSETIGEKADSFEVVNQKAKLFQIKKDSSSKRDITFNRALPSDKVHKPTVSKKHNRSIKLPLRELTEQSLLEQIAPSAALVNEDGDILYLHGRTGMYLELPSGETDTNNIIKMAREGLSHDLMLALHKAKTDKKTVHVMGLGVKTNGHFTKVNLTVRIVTSTALYDEKIPLYLVIIQKHTKENDTTTNAPSSSKIKDSKESDETQIIQSLKQELELQKKFLQDANAKLANSNEELKSHNEEIQSMNEELQSTNEELETSKEELQSVNEELSTVNSELHTKVTDLSQSNNDMNNLLAGTGVGTVFVDLKLSILRFTPATTKIINLILSDIGRPIGHIVSNLIDYDALIDDTNAVLDTLIPKEIEVQTKDHQWFLMRIQPYRTLDNVIEGAVISFMNITEIVTIRKSLKSANELTRLATVIRDSNDAITAYNLNGKIIAWNPSAEKLYGWSEPEALKMNIEEIIPKELNEEYLSKLKQLSNSKVLKTYNTKRLDKKGNRIDIHMTSTALIDNFGNIYAIATTERKTHQG